MKIGYDLYSLYTDDFMTFLRFVKSKRIKVFHIRYKEGMYMFYIPTYQRFLLRHFEGEIYYHQTIGLLKYVLYLSRQYMNIIGVMFFFISVIISSYFIFDIEIIGTLPKVNHAMENELKTLDVEKFTFLKSYERMNEILTSLKTTYKNDVEYINVYQVGSVFHVEYTKRKQEQLEKEEYQNLYAKKDGMIAYFDVDSGMIKVKQNDYVKKGDLLVENTLISTSEETKIIPVKGKVYAYTFNQYEASITNHNQDKGEAFYHLLLLIRSRLPANAKIDKENVLQMKRTRSKITLKMHYTLLEDISVKGESNEGSH